MKLRSLLIGVMLVIVVVVPAYAEFSAQYATVIKDANLREGPGTQYKVVSSVRAGYVVLLTGQSNDGKWYKLSTGTWISAGLVSLKSEQLVSTGTRTPTSAPTRMPTPRPTNTPIPGLIYELVGYGDSVEEIPTIDGIAVAVIAGNDESRYFGVTSYDKDGNRINMLVNATNPYVGSHPIGLFSEPVAFLEIKATGAWRIYILKGATMRALLGGHGSISGKGDDVFVLPSPHGKIAEIDGNYESRYFGVTMYTESQRKLLVNTTDPYQGTVLVGGESAIIVVTAEGEWTFTVK